MVKLKDEKDIVNIVKDLLKWKNIKLSIFSPLKISIYNPFQRRDDEGMFRISEGSIFFKNKMSEKGFKIAYIDEGRDYLSGEKIIKECKRIVIENLYGDADFLGILYPRYFEVLSKDNEINIVNIYNKDPIEKTLDYLIEEKNSKADITLLEKNIKYSLPNMVNIENLVFCESGNRGRLKERFNLLGYNLIREGLEIFPYIQEDARIFCRINPKRALINKQLKDDGKVIPKMRGEQLLITF